jgi:hypothetical protein
MDVSMAYKKKPQAEFSSFATVVGQKMSSDAQFKHLDKEIGILLAKNGAFTLSIAAAQGGNDAQKAFKRQCWDETINALDVLAFLVNIFANGDEQIIKAAGFELKKVAKAVTEVPMPTDFKGKNDERSTEASFTWKGSDAAVNYGLRYRTQGETAYQNGGFATACRVTLTGLTPKTYYEVCVQGLGRKNLESEWTEPVTVLVS